MKNEILAGKILIVDDESINVEVLEAILAKGGYSNVHSTTDPREVTDLHAVEHFDLIILDIRMPILDGFGVMERLSEEIHQDILNDPLPSPPLLDAFSHSLSRLRLCCWHVRFCGAAMSWTAAWQPCVTAGPPDGGL